jgi:hypothetical protein
MYILYIIYRDIERDIYVEIVYVYIDILRAQNKINKKKENSAYFLL